MSSLRVTWAWPPAEASQVIAGVVVAASRCGVAVAVATGWVVVGVTAAALWWVRFRNRKEWQLLRWWRRFG